MRLPHLHWFRKEFNGYIGESWPTTVKRCVWCGVYREIPWPKQGQLRAVSRRTR